MKKRWLNLVRVLVSAGALAFIIWRIDPGRMLAELRHVDWRFLLVAWLLFLLSLVIRAYRWSVLVRGLGRRVPFGRLVRLYFVGQFFSAFLPTAFGGDVVRALELTQDTDSAVAIGTVVVDRLSGLLVLFVMGLVVLPFNLTRIEPRLALALVAVAGGGLLLGALVLEGRFLQRITGWLPASLSLVGRGRLATLYAAITSCGTRALLSAFSVSAVFNVINVAINWLCGLALGAGLGLGYFFVATPLISVSLLIPSISGWGVREMVAQQVFASLGTEKATAIGIMIGLVGLAAGLIGGIVYGIEGLLGLRGRS